MTPVGLAVNARQHLRRHCRPWGGVRGFARRATVSTFAAGFNDPIALAFDAGRQPLRR